MLWSYFADAAAHRRDCAWKHEIRQRRIAGLDQRFSAPIDANDESWLDLSIPDIVAHANKNPMSARGILTAYGKTALRAQQESNCLTELIFDDALPEPPKDFPLASPTAASLLLHGVPISIKDCIDMVPYPSTLSFSRNVRRTPPRDAAIIRLLRDAGATMHVKSTIPVAAFGLETMSDIFGYTHNPWKKGYCAGASTGGGAALLAHRGSVIEVGTDIGGSLRIPAHFCGVYGLKSSSGRFPHVGAQTSLPGLEGVLCTSGAMSARLDDLSAFWERVMSMEPWTYDHSVVPLPWRKMDDLEHRKLTWAVVWEDGIIPPSPACTRALQWVVDALRREGHHVIDFNPPDITDAMSIAFPLLLGDGLAQVFDPLRAGESIEPAMNANYSLLRLPRFVRRFIAFLAECLAGDTIGAKLVRSLNPLSVVEERNLIVRRNEYRQRWFEACNNGLGADFVLTVPHPLPAFERGGTEKATLTSASYTLLFNFLDLPAGVMPITRVDPALDTPSPAFEERMRTQTCGAAKTCLDLYDAQAMAGLPLGVQVVGTRILEEEKVLKGMQIIQRAMQAAGRPWVVRRPSVSSEKVGA